MRISRYAFLIEDQNDYYAYSTLSNSLLNIDKEAFIFLKGIQNGNRELPAPDNLEEPFRSIMIENKILTENDEDDYLLFWTAASTAITALRKSKEVIPCLNQ